MKKAITHILAISAMGFAATTMAAEQTFEGRVIGLVACNNNQSVVLTLHNAQSDTIETFVTEAAPHGVLNPVLARAYVSVGMENSPPLNITYNPEYTGETCGQEVKGEWLGYVKK